MEVLRNQFVRSSYRESLKGLEADIQHANTLYVVACSSYLCFFCLSFFFLWVFSYGWFGGICHLRLCGKHEALEWKKVTALHLFVRLVSSVGIFFFFLGISM